VETSVQCMRNTKNNKKDKHRSNNCHGISLLHGIVVDVDISNTAED